MGLSDAGTVPHNLDLGELYRDGVLTDEEFAVAKQGLLRRF